MSKTRGSHWAKSVFAFVVKGIVTLTILTIVMRLLSVNNILHPVRVIPQGKTLRKYKINYRLVELITRDGIRLAA